MLRRRGCAGGVGWRWRSALLCAVAGVCAAPSRARSMAEVATSAQLEAAADEEFQYGDEGEERRGWDSDDDWWSDSDEEEEVRGGRVVGMWGGRR